MTRTMFDAINVAALPTTGADLYAGYDDGRWPDAAAIASRFPGVKVLRITVFPSDDTGDVLDIETGDATPMQAPDWLRKRRADGAWPTLYCNLSNWPQVQQFVAQAGLAQPPYWIAHYDHVPTLGDGMVAKQYESTPGYDISVVADHWPGIDGPSPQGAITLTPAALVRQWVIEFWGREPTVEEQFYAEVFLSQHGDDLTVASLYDHANAVAFRQKRGW